MSLRTAQAISPRFSNPSLFLLITLPIADNSNGDLDKSLRTEKNRRVHWKCEDRDVLISILKS